MRSLTLSTLSLTEQIFSVPNLSRRSVLTTWREMHGSEIRPLHFSFISILTRLATAGWLHTRWAVTVDGTAIDDGKPHEAPDDVMINDSEPQRVPDDARWRNE